MHIKLTVCADLVSCSGARHGHDSIAATCCVPCARRRSLNHVEPARWACGAGGSASGRERSSRAGELDSCTSTTGGVSEASLLTSGSCKNSAKVRTHSRGEFSSHVPQASSLAPQADSL
eukprot:364448-Chlamydomonas_euryale.AAC.2